MRVAWVAVTCIVASAAAAAAESKRPSNAEVLFRLAYPCPATSLTQGPCKGYVIDRVIPILCGGEEDPANMQWQTLAEAKEKDRWEKIGCRKGRKLVLPGTSASVTEAFAIPELPGGVQAQPLPPGGRAQPDAPRGSAAREGETPEEP